MVVGDLEFDRDSHRKPHYVANVLFEVAGDQPTNGIRGRQIVASILFDLASGRVVVGGLDLGKETGITLPSTTPRSRLG